MLGAGACLLLASAASSAPDLRASLPQADLDTMLRARGEQCDGCSHAEALSLLQQTDAAARDLAKQGTLDLQVRYCAA